MKTDIAIGLAHPVLGVGSGLRDGFIKDYLPKEAKGNYEINGWIKYQKKYGILKPIFPKLGEYTSRFGETGILGLFMFLLPAFYVVNKWIKNIRVIKPDEQIEYIVLFVALAGVMASGLGDCFDVGYYFWLVLGVFAAMVCSKDEGDTKDNEVLKAQAYV